MSKPTRLIEAVAAVVLATSPAIILIPRAVAATAPTAPTANQDDARSAPPASPSIHVRVNGEEVTDLEHAPVIRNGSMLIPLNGILDRMAATVAWQPLLGRVDVQRGATHLELQVGSAEAKVNGKAQEMDVAPELAGDVIMVPLRFTADSLGLYTSWNAPTRTISLSTSPPAKPATPTDTAAPPNPAPATAASATATPATASPGPSPTSRPGTPVSGPPVTPSGSTALTPARADGLPPELPPAASQPGAVPTAQGSTSTPAVGSIGTPVQQPTLNGALSQTGSPASLPSSPASDDTASGAIASITRKDGQAAISLDGGATFPISDSAILLANSGSGRSRDVITVDELNPGDQVVLHLDAHRQANLVEVSYRTVSDSIRAVAGDQILLASGQVLHTAPNVQVALASGKNGGVSDLAQGTEVLLRINPASGLVSRVDVGGAVASPIAQPGAAPAGSVWVENPGPYRAGDPMVVTLHGAPGAEASFTLPGSSKPFSMKEYEPGVYKGTAIIPPGISVKDAAVVGEIEKTGQPAAVLPSTTAITIDSSPPTIEQMSPAPGSVETNHQAAIYAVLDDHGGTGVDPSSIHLTLNGQDITGQSQVSERFVTCTAIPLVDGLNQVTVGVRDRAGNFSLAHWDFNVASLQNEIHKVSFSTSPSHGGERVAVKMDGIAGGDASFDVGSNWLAQPMHEVRPGHYEGVLMLERGDRVVNTPVIGHLRAGDHLYSLTSTGEVTFLDGRPAVPTIDIPSAGGSVQAPLVVAGHADPGVRVHVRIEYDNRALSRIGLRGFSSDQTVTADDTGAWRTGPMSLDSLTPHARHLAYVVSCEAINPAGTASKKAQITVYRDVP